MSRRAPETLVDWLVVGIAPFLIMLLVGSLVFYLVEVFYLGEYQARLLFVLGLFVMAVVCIARISMEEGAAYAAMYAAPLAVVVGLAVATFVKVTGPLEALGPMLNWGLMILIWWSANKLTWDCTLIEGGRDFTGQGLMQTTGLDRFFRVQTPEVAPQPATPQPPQPDLSGTSSTARPAPLPIWKWWNMNNDRPHAPGVWVVYFSIAALPLFGLGQWFIPADDAHLALRRKAFWLLVVYVAAGLSLLMATSFLSLRRYLRQRNQEMPGEMAAVWLGTGTAIIFILLLLASFLPRPIPEYSITHLAPQIKSPDQKASRWGWGKEGAKKKDAASPQTGTQGQADPATTQGSSQGQPTPNAQGNSSQNGSSGSNGNKAGGQDQNNNQNQSGGQQNNSQGSTGKQTNNSQQNSSDPQNQNSQSSEGNQSHNNSANSNNQSSSSQNNTQANQQQSSNENNSQSNQQPPNPQQHPNNNSQPSSPPPPTESQSTPPLPNEVQVSQTNYLAQAWGQVFAYLTHALKWLFYLLVIGAIAYYAWQHREWLIAAWQQLLKELRELWARWFGQKPHAVVAAPVAPPPPPKRFAEYADPFASGLAARWTLAELVRYTFEALEARGREQNCPRGNDQTPLEYAAAVGQVEPDFASEFRSLADLYGQLAFAGGSASPQSTSWLQQLWQRWRSS